MAIHLQFTNGQMSIPENSIPGQAQSVSRGNRAPAATVIHHFVVPYKQDDGSSVAAAIVPFHAAFGSGVIKRIVAWCIDAPSGGGSEEITVDLQKGDADVPTAFATVLSAAISITDSQSDMEQVAGTVSDDEYDAGDVFQLVITAAGSGGTQGEGLGVSVFFQEHSEND